MLSKIKKYKTKDIIGFFGLIGIALFIIISEIKGRAYRKDLAENGCYTIGTTVGYRYVYKTGSAANYVYTYNNVEYKDWYPSIKGVQYKGGKYLVQVLPSDPNRSDLDFTVPIKGDTIPYQFRPLCPCVQHLEHIHTQHDSTNVE
jgi:hypothetical protein